MNDTKSNCIESRNILILFLKLLNMKYVLLKIRKMNEIEEMNIELHYTRRYFSCTLKSSLKIMILRAIEYK